MAFSVYSLADTYTTINNPDVGKMVLSDCGAGRITWSYAGEMSNNTTSATGYTVINRLVSKSGQISIEVPVNSDADLFLRKWIAYLKAKSTPTKRYGLTSLIVKDSATGRTNSFSGVVPQKEPDENYDAVAGNRQYNLLFAELVQA
ncbi:MAG: DUF3277 family protein [Lachnospiraceae bacterium]|nr:DUF3277 family protein [Lachnospiraceae bacterium]